MMPNYYVAKSYQEWEKLTDAYESNGRMYYKLQNPKGGTKEVRAYSETEYRRLYKESPCGLAASPSVEIKAPAGPVVKNVLGFQEGYIWIFKGDLARAEYWFEQTSECRYHVTFGWYIVSTESVPFNIPSCIESVQLPWEKVGNTDGTLLPKGIIEAVLNEIRYGGHPSQFQGAIGSRLTLTLYLKQIETLPPTQYGAQTIYTFEDKDANIFVWKTGVNKDWSIGDEIHCKAGVKSHDTVRGIRQTTLTRLIQDKEK
jgi:hypothetical protein